MRDMTIAKKLSVLLSFAFAPQVSSAYAFVLLFLVVKTSVDAIAITLLFSSAVQVASLLIYAKASGGDLNVDSMKGRSLLFTVAVASYCAGFLALIHVAAPYPISVLMLCYAINTTVAAIMTKYVTKVSAHVWGVAGPSVVILYAYGIAGFAAMLVLASIVGAARVSLRKHTWAQVALALVLSVLVTSFIVYALAPAILLL